MDEENKNASPTSEQTVDYTESKVDNAPKTETKNTEAKVESNPKSKEQPKAEKPKKKKKVGLIVSIVIIILAVIGGAVGGAVYALVFAKTEIDLAKYVKIEFEGYEGYASFDESDLEVDEKGLKKVLEDKKLASKLAERLLDKAEVKENENLKNGDEIEVKFKISEDWLKENKIKLTSNTVKFKVKDLDEPNTIDLFEDIEFSYSGVSPDLTVSLKNNSTDSFIKNKVSFTMEKSKDKNSSSSYSLYDIANGDKIKVKASYSKSDLEDAGYVVKDDEYEFTVEGQAEYITSADSLTADVKTALEPKMTTKAKSISGSLDYSLRSAYSEDFGDIGHYDYNLSHEEPVLEKMYIAINNDLENKSYYDSNNVVYGIYKVAYTDSSTSKTYDYYIAVEVSDIVVNSEGLYTQRTYSYYEFSNYNFKTADGLDYHRTADGIYSAIENDLGSDYTLTEVK